jgi:pimeloyl-ACP methyl ester carboxylesterase
MPLSGTYHQIDGVKVFCRVSGQGDPLLLVHGFLVSQRCWDRVLEPLGRHFTLYAVDLPGHGESDRPGFYAYSIDAFAGTLAGLMDSLGLTWAHALGHALGGTVVLALAAQFPERMRHLALVAPAVGPAPIAPLTRMVPPALGEAIFTRMLSRRALRAYLHEEVYLDPALPSEQTLQFYWERLNRAGGRRAAFRTSLALEGLLRQRPSPRHVRSPVQIVRGDRDRICPVGRLRRLSLELPTAEMVHLAAAGHAPMEEHPEALCDAVLPFLRGAG